MRPLQPDGATAFRFAAMGLWHVVPIVDTLMSSPAVRARQTADILADVCAWPEPDVVDALGPGASVLSAAAAIRRRDDEGGMALVGHEPQLSELLSLFIGSPVRARLSEGAVCCVGFGERLAEGSGTLLWLATPSMLRRLGGDRKARGVATPSDLLAMK
jgi:phosphohistidine phosphatase